MDEWVKATYLRQAKLDCEYSLEEFRGLQRALEQGEFSELVRAAQRFVQQAAAVSRIFWPPFNPKKHSRARANLRGEQLCLALKIDASHVVAVRGLRDHLEHLDERLDDWAENSKNRNMFTLVGPPNLGGNALQPGDVFHHFDPATATYYFRGEAFDIQALADGITDIQERIESELARRAWEPKSRTEQEIERLCASADPAEKAHGEELRAWWDESERKRRALVGL